jgi:hypothetical protein
LVELDDLRLGTGESSGENISLGVQDRIRYLLRQPDRHCDQLLIGTRIAGGEKRAKGEHYNAKLLHVSFR